LFHIDLPKGTRVTDRVLGVKYVVGDSNSVQTYLTPESTPPVPSLINKPLLDIANFGMKLEDTNDKVILVCFFDIEQRPSRNCIIELNKRIQELEEKEIAVVAVHASKIEKEKLNEWIKENEIEFTVGMIQDDPSTTLGTGEEKTHFNWGVQSLPWLILTDKNHIVTNEGFSVNELDEKIITLNEN
jgi:hypothetical protein